MDEENNKKENIEETLEVVPEVAEEVLEIAEEIAPVPDATLPKGPIRNQFKDKGGRGRRPQRKGGRRDDRPRSEFDQKLLGIRRVTRVVAGGRRMSFAVALVAGNRKGKVGVGTGKSMDTSMAIDKAFRNAKKNMITIPLTKNNSIPHDVKAKYAASVITLRPSKGRGLVAGGAVRSVLELAGVTDISAKILSRSKNALNNAKATIKVLQGFSVRKRNQNNNTSHANT